MDSPSAWHLWPKDEYDSSTWSKISVKAVWSVTSWLCQFVYRTEEGLPHVLNILLWEAALTKLFFSFPGLCLSGFQKVEYLNLITFSAVTNTLLVSHEGMQVKDGGHLPWDELQSPARVQVPWSNPCQPVISSRMSICDSLWHLLSHQSATQLCVLAYVDEQKSFCMSPDSLCPHPKEGGLKS